jgi:hypothetical protein
MNDIMEYTKNENFKYLVIKASHGNYYGFTSRLRRNVPMPRQRGNGGGAAAVLGWSRIGGSGSGILAVAMAEWQASQRC